MRADVIRLYKTLHTWTGIIAGMALFIAFYAGAITVFKEPLARWATPPSGAALAVPLDQAPALISGALAAQPALARGFTLRLEEPAPPRQSGQAGLVGPGEGTRPDGGPQAPVRLTWQTSIEGPEGHDPRFVRHLEAALQADGVVLAQAAHPTMLGETLDVLHRVVGLPVDSDPNRWVMGVVAVLYSLALISGVVVLIPTLVKDFFALRTGKNLKRMWLDAHNVVGIVSLPFHIVMALTSVVFAFHDGIYDIQDRVFHESKLEAAFRPGPPSGDAARDPSAMLAPRVLLARARTVSPSFRPTSLHYVNLTSPGAMVRIWGHDETAVAPRGAGGFVALDPYSGEVRTTDYMPGLQGPAHATISSFFALHFATFGGNAVRWIYFLLGLAGAWLFYSGNLLWIESRRKALRQGGEMPRQRRDVRLMAAATVGVCVGCVCGVALTVLAAKWLHGRVADLSWWHMTVYYAGFFACVGWAFARGAARASAPLLRVAGCLTLAVPATTLMAWALPGLGLWANRDGGALGVDITALAMGLGLLAMARAAALRARAGAPDSVWSNGSGRAAAAP